MEFLDIAIFVLYGVIIVIIGNWKTGTKGKEQDSNDYFFAGKSLPWFLVGSSVIAANISAEQFIGMSGSGYAMGLAIATYEWISALIIVLVAKYFLPIFVKNEIYTMPQFLEKRFDKRIKSILAVFWLMLFVLVNLSSILYLGALALKTIFGIRLVYGIMGLAFFSLLYTVVNGLKAIARTDVIQVGVLLIGGFITTWLAVDTVGEGQGLIEGFKLLYNEVPDKFHMVLKTSDPNYKYMPGIRAIFGGIWIAALYYWGLNQYIIQKALGAKSLNEAQTGLAFAGYIKLILPFVVVIPGIAAFALHADIAKPDEAYPWILENVIPTGIRGVIFAALIAAIVSSFSAIINSTSTIFTMDIYKPLINKTANEKSLVSMGRISSIVATIIAVFVAMGLDNLEQAFQFIQEFTGIISPGVTAIFVLGLYWKRTSSKGALWGTIVSIPIASGIKYLFPEIPFLDQMLIAFFIIAFIIVIISLVGKNTSSAITLELNKSMYKTSRVFNVMAIGIVLILITIYTIFY